MLLIVRAVSDKALAATSWPFQAEGVHSCIHSLGHTTPFTSVSTSDLTCSCWHASIVFVFPASHILNMGRRAVLLLPTVILIAVAALVLEDRAIGLDKSLEVAVSTRGAATALHDDIVSFLSIPGASLVGLISPASVLVVWGG